MFFSWEIHTCNYFCFIIYLFIFILFLTLCFWHSHYLLFFFLSKTWLCEHFSILNRYKLLFLEHVWFYFNFFMFLCYHELWFSYHHYYYDYFHGSCSYYYFCHCHWYYYFFYIIIVSVLLTFIVLAFIILFYPCIYRICLNFKQMTSPNIAQSWQQKHWDCITDTVFVWFTLLKIFFWSQTIIFCPW